MAGSQRLSSEQLLELWRRYKSTGDRRLRDRLVLTFAPMVKYIVYRKIREIPARCDADDFISCGLEALIRSLERYDPSKGASLEHYLWTRIHGAVLDELRANDWAPRSLRRWDRDLNRARDEFVTLYKRAPTHAELAEALGVPERKVREHVHQLARGEVESLNTLVLGEDGAAVLLYVYGLTLREIGEILGVSESRVCQIHGQILGRLRGELERHEPLFLDAA
jgi:RNA polymerase sigma factor for flagellar operon FliA